MRAWATIPVAAWHESGHAIVALALGADVESVVVRPNQTGRTVFLASRLDRVANGAVYMAGPEAEMIFAGASGPHAYGHTAALDRARLAAFALSAAQEVAAFDLCRTVLRRNSTAVWALADRFRPDVVIDGRGILYTVAGLVTYFKQVQR